MATGAAAVAAAMAVISRMNYYCVGDKVEVDVDFGDSTDVPWHWSSSAPRLATRVEIERKESGNKG